MIRLSHFAAPVALGAVLFIGAQGCSHEHPDEVPSSAAQLSAGKEDISATAPKDGMVYVYDITANKPLYVANVKQGDQIRVDAKHNQLVLNDKIITKRDDLPDGHRYKIFFDRTEMDRQHERDLESQRTQQERDRELERQRNSATIIQPAPAAPPTVIVPPQQPPANNQGTTVVVPQQKAAENPSGTTVVVPQQQQPQQQQPANNNGGTTVVVPPPQPAR
jgi:hypothetical protein